MHSCQSAINISPPPKKKKTNLLCTKALKYLQHRDFCHNMSLLWQHKPLTDHWRLYKTPRISLGDVGLQDPGSSSGFVHPTEDVDLPTTNGSSGRMHGLGQRSDGLPLVGDCIVPEMRAIGVSWDDAMPVEEDRQAEKAGWDIRERQLDKLKKSRGGNVFSNIIQIQPLGK